MTTTAATATPDLTDYDPDRAAKWDAIFRASDVARADQAQADKRHRGEKQREFDERGLPRAKAGWVL